jgi:hypothetical protein
MQIAFQRSIRISLVSLVISAAFGASAAFAQSGSAGGSIGNDEKSLSGSRATPRTVETDKPARRSKPEADEPRRAAKKSSGGGGGSFDGAWIVSGVGVTCQGSGSNPIVITSGKLYGETVRGTVSPNGALYGTTTGGGPTIVSVGRLSGRSGSGTFRRSSDGCTGTWTASKQ